MVKKASPKLLERNISANKQKKYFSIIKVKKNNKPKLHKTILNEKRTLQITSPQLSLENTQAQTISQTTQESSKEQNISIPKLTEIQHEHSSTQVKITSKEEWEKYYKKEDVKLFKNYGHSIFSCSKKVEETTLLSVNNFKRHSFPHFLRLRMVECIHKIILKTNKEMETFFLTFFILDSFLTKTQSILNERMFFLFSVTSLNIASKIESVVPFHINDCIKISHLFSVTPFTENEIKETEIEILNTLNYDFVFVSRYDFIKIYFTDFYLNNLTNITQGKMERYVLALENISVFFSKITLLESDFYQFNQSYIAIACIIVGYELLTSNSKKINEKISIYLWNWVHSLINKVNDQKQVKDIYNLLKELLKRKIPTEMGNYQELYYD
jgi:hypothetical protein